MESETKKKVNDLFSLMEGISSEIDLKAEIARLNTEVAALQDALQALTARCDALEKGLQHKRGQVKQIQKEMRALLDELK